MYRLKRDNGVVKKIIELNLAVDRSLSKLP